MPRTTYHPFLLDLSDEQLKRIADGSQVRLKPEDIDNSKGDTLLLTTTQINRLKKAKAAGKGAQLSLSKTQQKHQAIHGSGRFSNFFKSVGQAIGSLARRAVPALKQTARQAASQLLDAHGDRIAQKGAQLLGSAAGHARAATTSVTPAALQPLVDHGIQIGNQFGQEQLQALLQGIRSTVTGSGLFLPGQTRG